MTAVRRTTTEPAKRRRPILERTKLVQHAPKWGDTFEKWSRLWVYKHHWKVAHIVPTIDDGIQECALVFAKTIDRYGYTVDNDKWFMALYMRSVYTRWIELSRLDKKHRELFFEYNAEDTVNEATGEAPDAAIVYSDGPMIAALSASAELRLVLETLIDAPSEVIAFIFTPRAHEAITNRVLRRMCGLSRKSVDIIGQLRDFHS